MKKKSSKPQLNEKKGLSWWHWALIALAVLFILDMIEEKNDYKNCVDYCVYDLEDCVGSSMKYVERMGYIEEYDAEDCSYDLEDCVGYCEG